LVSMYGYEHEQSHPLPSIYLSIYLDGKEFGSIPRKRFDRLAKNCYGT
jgi:hypothetical protein